MLMLGTTGMFAQNQVINDELIPDGRMQQHEDFMADKTPYPAKPRNMWAVGVHVGIPQVSGDVRTRPFGGPGGFALGYGAFVRKALGYAASLRLGYTGGTAYGQNWEPQAVGGNDALLDLGYSRAGTDMPFVHNYENKFHDIALEVLVNLNNLKYHKSENKVAFFLSGGLGALLYKTAYDATDGTTMYDFSGIVNTDFDGRKDQRDAIEALLDGEFETVGEVNDNSNTLGDSTDPTNLRIRGSLGAGIQFKLGKRVSLDIEHRAILAFDDLLDGRRWERGGFTFTSSDDILHYSSIGISIHIGGKATEPSWFTNPMDYVYSELKAIQPPDMADEDGDGVLDHFGDEELDTPEGFPVDSRGVTLDSDKDGCPDAEDPEPFSSPNYPIQDCKNVMPSYMTAEEVEQLVDNKLEPVLGGAGSNWFLPDIHFDFNRSTIKPDAYDELRYVADVMKKYPNLKMQVTGFADSRGREQYNLDLSKERAEAAIKHLVDNHSIGEGRFELRYKGEEEPLYQNARNESQYKMNRRVEFAAVGASK